MKILCKRCHKVLGEQEPLEDSSYVQAKCADCILEEKAISFEFLKESLKLKDGSGMEVTLEDGSKGLVIAPVKGIEDLGLSEIVVAGRKINCPTVERSDFQKYLDSLPDGNVEVIYHFSLSMPIPGKKRHRDDPVDEEGPAPICRYCVAKVPKVTAFRLFDRTAEKYKGMLDLLSKIIAKDWMQGGWMKYESKKNME